MVDRVRLVVGACLAVVFLLLLIAGVATDHWSTSSGFYFGLWSYCASGGSTNICSEIPRDTTCGVGTQFPDDGSNFCAKFNATRAFAILTILFGGATLISCMAALAGKGSHIAVLVLTALEVVCGLIASSIYGAVNHDIQDFAAASLTLDYSFGIFTAGWIFFSVGGFLAGSQQISDSGDSSNPPQQTA